MANYISQVTLPSGASYNVRELFPHVGNCTDAAATAAKTVTIGNFKLYTGAWVVVKFSNTNSAAVASLTLNVDGTGAKPIKYRNANLSSAGLLIANRYTYFVYDGTNYQIVGDFDTNSDTYDRNRYKANIKAGTSALVAGNIIVGKDGVFSHLKSGGSFDISYPILYLNAAVAAGETTNNSYDIINFTITTTQSISLTAYLPVFIKGTLSGKMFTPASTVPLTQTVPTTDDGYQYMYLGNATSTSAVYLTERHPIYVFKNNAFGEIVHTARNANNIATTVTPGSSSELTNYGVIFTVDPSISEPNVARKNNDFRIQLQDGTASTAGWASLILGNATSSGTAGNKEGRIVLYSTSTSYHKIIGDATTSIYDHTLPNISGTISMLDKNGTNYWGLVAGNSKTDWVRTTQSGIIPYQNGGAGSGHSSLGTSTWYFAHAYIDTVHGSLDGNAATATKATQDESGNNIKATYAASFSISDHTITLKNKNDTSLETVTVPDEKVKATKLAQSTAEAVYYPTLVSGAGTAGVSIFDSAKINHTPGTTSVVGNTRLILGNATASGTANNEEGLLRIYSSGTKYHTLQFAKITNDHITHTFPTTGGTILNTGNYTSYTIPFAKVTGSADADTYAANTGWYDWNTTSGTNMPTENWGILLSKGYPSVQMFLPDTGNAIYLRKKTNASTAGSSWMSIRGTAGVDYNLASFVSSSTLNGYLPLSGGKMTGTIQGTYTNTHIALAGGGIGDYATLDHKNNINISSWNGVSISNGCSSVGTLDQVTFSVNARTGTTQQRGNAILYSESGNSPALIFQRGTFLDNVYDWKMYVNGGNLYFEHSITSSSSTQSWVTDMMFLANDKQLKVTSATSNTTPCFFAERSDTSASAWFGIGSGGVNHGIFSGSINSWVFVANATEAQTYNIAKNPSTATTYAISFGGAGESGVGVPTNGTFTTGVKGHYINDGLGYRTREGVANGTEGLSALVLGNSLASSVAKNKTGYVRQYSTNEYYTDLKPNTLTASRTILLPDAAGTIAVFPAARTSGQVVVTDGTAGAVKSSGYTIATSVPSGAKFTDANLTQTAVGSTYTNYRPIVISDANSATEGFSPSTTTSGTFITSSLYCQPSTGMLHANIFKAGKASTTDGEMIFYNSGNSGVTTLKGKAQSTSGTYLLPACGNGTYTLSIGMMQVGGTGDSLVMSNISGIPTGTLSFKIVFKSNATSPIYSMVEIPNIGDGVDCGGLIQVGDYTDGQGSTRIIMKSVIIRVTAGSTTGTKTFTATVSPTQKISGSSVSEFTRNVIIYKIYACC